MKFVGIIFCVLLFCSKIVDSNPQSEGQIRQRAYQSSNWPVNKNVANEEYPDTDFTQPQNVDTLINPTRQETNENVRNYYPNQARYATDLRFKTNPNLSQRAVIENDDSSEDGRILESYPSRVERYPIRTSQIRSDDQRRNWQPPNQYVRSQVVLSENERPLETVEESYRPVQFVKPKYIPPVNQRFRQPDRSFLAREQYQYPIRNAEDTEYVANPAPRYPPRGSVTYENFSEDQDTPIETRVRLNNQKYVQNPGIISQSRIVHNVPRDNTGYVENEQFRVDVNTAPISNYNDSPSGVSVVENYDADTINPVNQERVVPVEVNKVPPQRPPIQSYPNNFRPNLHWNNVARHQTYNAAPAPINYQTDLGSNNPAPVNDNSGSPSAPIIQRPVNSEAEDELKTPYFDNENPDRNLYQQLTSGVQKYDINKIVTNPQVKNVLAANNKRFIVFHPNGTIENVDKVDLELQSHSKFRFVHTNPQESDVTSVVTESQVVTETPAQPHVPTNIVKFPVRGYRAPPNVNLEVVDTNTKPLPPSLPVEDADLKVPSVIKPVGIPLQDDEGYSQPQPSFEAPPENVKLKISPLPVFEPATDDNLKPLPKKINEQDDEEASKPLLPNETQSLNDDTKPQPEEPIPPVNQNQFVRPYRPLFPYPKRPISRPPFKPLPPYARNGVQPIFPLGDQPANDEKLSPIVENDETPRENLPEAEKDNSQPLNSDDNPKPKIEHPQLPDIETKVLPDVDQSAVNGKPKLSKPQVKEVVYDGSFQPIENSPAPTTPSNEVSSTTISPIQPENKLPKKQRRKLPRRPSTTTTPAPTSSNPDKNSEDETITISPIELITDNVSDVPPTTPSPVKQPGSEDSNKDKKQSSTTPTPSKEDKEKSTTVSPINTTTVPSDVDNDEAETKKSATDNANSPSEDGKIVVSINPEDDDEEGLQLFKTNCKTIQAYSDDEDGEIKIDLPKGKDKGDSGMWVKTTNQEFIDILTGSSDSDMDMIYVFNIDYRPIIEREKHTQIFPNGTVVITTKETTYSGKNDSKPKTVTTSKTMQIEDYDSDED